MHLTQNSPVESAPATSSKPASAYDDVLGAKLHRTSVWTGWITIFGGAAVLLGWLAESAWLPRLLPALPAMAPSTALCFTALGSALLLLLRKQEKSAVVARRAGKVLAVTVFACAGSVFCGKLWFGGTGLDQPLSILFMGNSEAALMSPTTAFCFLLLSAALYAGDRRFGRTKQIISQWLALATIVAAVVVLHGYIYGIAVLYRYHEGGMAVHTGAIFLILGVGTLFLYPDRGFVSRLAERSVAGTLSRRFLAGGIALFLALATLIAAGERAGWYGIATQNALLSAGGMLMLTILVWHSTSRIEAAERVRAQSEEKTRQLYEETKRAYAEASAAGQAKDQFLAMLSHELRTPLTPALLAVRELQHELKLPGESAESLKLIERNIELQTRLIDDLLDVTRIRTGKLYLQLISCDLHDVVEHALRVCKGDIDAKHLNTEVALNASQHIVRGDCARLHQVFWNLLKNAVKFTPEKGTIQVHSDDAGDGRIRICVRDSGIGIEPELLDRVFDTFEQGTEATPKKLGGLGLGLAITKAITEAHHGTISAHSAGKGRGSSFEVILPATLPVSVQKGAEAPPKAGGEPQQSLRILLVEDHADTRNLLQKLLQRRGHIVLPASDISTAKEIAKGAYIDLLLTDLSLPDGNGRILLEHVRSEKGRVGAVVMSGHGSEQATQESLSAGFDAYLMKPVSLDSLESTIARVVSANG